MWQFIIDNWDKFASLVLSVIAITIAILSSRQTSKDATKQVKSIKELARLQIEIAIIQFENELSDTRHRWRKNSNQLFDKLEENHSIFGYQNNDAIFKIREMKEKEQNLQYEKEYIDKQMKSLESVLKRLENIKNDLGSI